LKNQWTLLVGIFLALIVAIFAVINVEPVTVNYLFGKNEWPLVLVILGSFLMGGLMIGFVGIFRMYALQKNIKTLKKENDLLKKENASQLEKTIEKEDDTVPTQSMP